ncbi:hypothetical protein RUM43_013903 [Polyplax serrata]|uniref:Uncharacterized protein n=1 Tax=Polyplax serrata TaxID=468196 RepID=A0AAN8PHI7_POLSC
MVCRGYRTLYFLGEFKFEWVFLIIVCAEMKESSYDELTDAVFHEKEGITVGYPFALVLRMRVIQIVCGISTLVMGAVALIDEKSQFNLGFGIPAGLSTVLASANSIYYSKGFDGYQPASEKKKWPKLKFLGTTVKSITFNVVLWGLSTLLIAILTINCVRTVLSGKIKLNKTFYVCNKRIDSLLIR